MAETIQLTKHQQRLLRLVYKFRFITIPLLAKVLNIRNDSTYEAIKPLVGKRLLVRVYKESWRIDRKPAYYYLSKKGVTTVRRLLELPDGAVNPVYQNHRASSDFIQECLMTVSCYAVFRRQLPEETVIRTKTEINRFKIFPKHRPDLYIKTPDGKEIFISIMAHKLPYFVNNRLKEYVEHSEDEGWKGDYPVVAFILRDNRSKLGFLFKAQRKLEEMGYDEDEITILATSMDSLSDHKPRVWGNAFNPPELTMLSE